MHPWTKIAVTFLLTFVAPVLLTAQQIIVYDRGGGQLARVSVSLADSLSGEPVAYASVYLVARGDTAITHFTLTDAEGKAVLREIPFGRYRLTAEMMGYKPVNRTCYFRKGREDLGTLKMHPDSLWLDAARVEEAVSPLTFRGDTLEYNALAFHVTSSDMLGDLLRKMPGIEVDKNGGVTVNGEKVSRITVGGRTFFLDDVSAAVNNLPARVVNKIKVFDKTSETEQFTGIREKSPTREKVMDLSFKKEYEQGWFGHARALAGRAWDVGETDPDLVMERPALYDAGGLVSAYSKEDQLTFLGDIHNVSDGGSNAVLLMTGGPTARGAGNGITRTQQVGTNWNTSRIKGLDAAVSVSYKGSDRDTRRHSRRTTFSQVGENLESDDLRLQHSLSHAFQLGGSLANGNRNKWFLHFTPNIQYVRDRQTSSGATGTWQGAADLNRSSVRTALEEDRFSLRGNLDVGNRQLGKPGRSLMLMTQATLDRGSGWEQECSRNDYLSTGTTELRNLLYRNVSHVYQFSSTTVFTEPLAERWSAEMRYSFSMSGNDRDRAAYDGNGEEADPSALLPDRSSYTVPNEWFSSRALNEYRSHSGSLVFQYARMPYSVQVGGNVVATVNSTYSRSFGQESRTGEGEVLWNSAPFVSFSHYGEKGIGLDMSYTFMTSQPPSTRMLPALDLSDPSRITLGNIYLRPSQEGWLTGSLHHTGRRKRGMSSLNCLVRHSLRNIVTASWLDGNGIRYAIPVNSSEPEWIGNLNLSGTWQLDKARRWSVNGLTSVQWNRNASWQNTSSRPGIDADHFDYGAFMSDFWGGPSGDRFFSGESGFSPAVTDIRNYSASVTLRYRKSALSGSASYRLTRNTSRYSLDDRGDTRTWNHVLSGDVRYEAPKGFTLDSDASYRLYRGYTAGFGAPELIWNARLSKAIGAFVLQLSCQDLLGQRRSFSRNISQNYVEDVYTNVVGRCVLLGARVNFGKMNARHSQRAELARIQMMN